MAKRTKLKLFRWLLIRVSLWTVVVGLLVAAGAFFWIDRTIQDKFSHRLWDLPVHIYSAPFEIYPGMSISVETLVRRLHGLGYRQVASVARVGEFAVDNQSVELITRPFGFWDGPQPSSTVNIRLVSGKIGSVTERGSSSPIPILRLRPQLIGSLSQSQHQDRYLVELDEYPRLLLETLLVVEDRRFLKHHGVDLWAVARAGIANVLAGRIVQGGSTLTQQLIKNVYGRDDLTFTRKIQEAATAVVLELRLDKRQILQAYCSSSLIVRSRNSTSMKLHSLSA